MSIQRTLVRSFGAAGLVALTLGPASAAGSLQAAKVYPSKHLCLVRHHAPCAASSFAKPGDACVCIDTNGTSRSGVVH